MSSVSLKNITKKFKDTVVLQNIDMQIEDGQFVTLLGPSGCGKSTILRILSGLIEQDSGEIFVDDTEISTLAASKRNVGMVFQSYALFPNLNVFDNVAFGLQVQKLPKNQINEEVQKILHLVDLEDKAQSFPHELSGGQQQRVALARSIIVKPRVLLLDEPLSALDAQIRKRLQDKLREIQQELNMTTILVTHDQEEAMHVSDKIFVMSKGQIAQIGTPLEIYTQPKSDFIASFIGNYNIFTFDELKTILMQEPAVKALKYAIRPEAIHANEQPGSYRFEATAKQSIMSGNIIKSVFEKNGLTLTIEQLHRDATEFIENNTYTLFIEKENLIPLVE
ncbi:ABC transporter ATP-binding protein [Lysinibacillus sp. 2017]|uniref:ABC transporter ATP-binding protein n=1 Tax=unclassified Lysinibacillus TaxID=2636778 RepID=UPI000D528422|nr:MULTISPECIES: ABC transporter ATP-binding protein [unclassified Lysinibacillus]AWE06901.1 ABC transporter ATP-binding protein [Lysinibacillus sp. 2017]TGN37168.1 ABC transporter ATP-binding protein [Lysinibacillus sp. S2017]